MKSTFKDLEENIGKAIVRDLKDTLEDYAVGSLSINSHVVIKLIKHLRPDDSNDIKTLLLSAEKGFREQNRRNESKAADEYKQVIRYLRELR